MQSLISHVAEPEDYTLPVPFSVTFSSADLSADIIMQCLNITIVEDSVLDCDRDFTVGIESVTPAASDDLSSSITVSIDDSVDGKPATHQIPPFSLRQQTETQELTFYFSNLYEHP